MDRSAARVTVAKAGCVIETPVRELISSSHPPFSLAFAVYSLHTAWRCSPTLAGLGPPQVSLRGHDLYPRVSPRRRRRPNPIAAASMIPAAGIWQMIIAIGALEVANENKWPSPVHAGNLGVHPPIRLQKGSAHGAQERRLLGIISYACAVSLPGSVPFYLLSAFVGRTLFRRMEGGRRRGTIIGH